KPSGFDGIVEILKNPSYRNYTIGGSYWYNSSGQKIVVKRLAKGRYRVTFRGIGGRGRSGGHVQVTGYGSDNKWAKVRGWNSGGKDFIVYVDCYNPNGTAADARFNIHVVWR
ncbi:MAG: hypothetical protein IH987_00785, partial [Planctomycetes bacterium]|nr:hypothetical protein [Planctomycetota bacterium]